MIRRFLLLAGLVGAVPLLAQDEPAPPPPQEARAAVIVTAEDDGNGNRIESIEMATTDGGQVFAFAPGAGGMSLMMGGGNPLEPSEFLLNDPAIQKELELLDAQRDQLAQVQQEFGTEMRAKLDETMKAGDKNPEAMRDFIKDVNQRKKQRISEILLPHQIDRLRQISLQSNVNSMGLSQALFSKTLMDELKIKPEQKEALQKKADELNKDFEKKVAELKSAMREELMDVLDPEQRDQLTKLLGDKFEFENQSDVRVGPRAFRTGRPPQRNPGN
jgi:hypothetical protein